MREWTCEDCGYVNKCWCSICHGCQDVTYEDDYEIYSAYYKESDDEESPD